LSIIIVHIIIIDGRFESISVGYILVVSNYPHVTDRFREERSRAYIFARILKSPCDHFTFISPLRSHCRRFEMSEGRSRFSWIYKLPVDRLRDELSWRGLDDEGSVTVLHERLLRYELDAVPSRFLCAFDVLILSLVSSIL